MKSYVRHKMDSFERFGGIVRAVYDGPFTGLVATFCCMIVAVLT